MRICFPTMTYTKVAIKKEICFSSMFPVQTVGSALSTGQETLSVGIHLNATMKEIISVRMQKSDA